MPNPTTAIAKELYEIMKRLNVIDAELADLQLLQELPLANKGTRLNWLMGEMRSLLARVAELMDEARGKNPAP